MKHEKKALDVINDILKDKDVQINQIDIDLSSLNIDSITFIRIVVALEGEFDFEFDDEMLLITKFPTIKTMIEYVESKMK